MISRLCNGEIIIYVGTRLFNIADKLSGNKLEQTIYKSLNRFLTLNKYPIYLPFRDTNEEELLKSDNAFEIIYNEDIKRLNNLFAFFCYLDDPSKDDGICMEIGYAYGRRAPVIVLTSDVQYYRLCEDVNFDSDPIIHRMASAYISYPHIEETSEKPSSDCVHMQEYANDYEKRLLSSERRMLSKIDNYIAQLVSDYQSLIPTEVCILHERRNVFIDFSGQKYEWARIMTHELSKALEKLNISSYLGDRFVNDSRSLIERGESDISKMLSSDLFVVCSDGAETDAGSAALVGLAKSQNIPIILYNSASSKIVEGKSVSSRNLMIELSASATCASLEGIATIVQQMLKEKWVNIELYNSGDKLPT